MSSTFGEFLKLSVFGQSHGAAIGMVLDGIPAGLPVSEAELSAFLQRRAPGRNRFSTPRKEADAPEFLSGILDGFTCGAPIAAVIRNTNTRSSDYSDLKEHPRPGHADYTADVKYGGFQDASGGGHFSGRLTAPICIAGGLCLQWLRERGVTVFAHIAAVAGIEDKPLDPLHPLEQKLWEEFPVLDPAAGSAMEQAIEQARLDQDSVGGIVECAAAGLPAGLGEPMFGGVESKIAQILYGIPAVKGVEFGSGFASAALRGSQNNDPFLSSGSRILTETNHAGGILGGITDGMPLLFRAAFKPTPSIGRQQKTVSLSTLENTSLQVQGRHDPCIVPRAVPVVEAAAAIAIFDLILGNTQTDRRKKSWI